MIQQDWDEELDTNAGYKLMDPNFHALQLIAEIALGILGFSAILIGLSRTSDGFSAPDNFRIQLLTYSCNWSYVLRPYLPFAIFGDSIRNYLG